MGQLKEELILKSENFNSNIDKVIRKVESLKKKGSTVGNGFDSQMSKMIKQATGFNGSLGSLIGVVGKFAGGLGIAISASEAFNKVIHSSQTLTDEFGATQQGVTTVVDNFFRSLASGDFSPFLNGMDNMVSKAREAYNTMDELWNMAQSFSVQNARLNNQFNKNLNEIREKKNSKDPKDQKRVKELTEQNKRIIEQQAKGGVKLYNQTISGLQSEIAAGTGMNSKITEDAIFRIIENDIANPKGKGREKYKKQYENYLKEYKDLNKKYDKDLATGGVGRYGVSYSKEKNALEKKYGESIAANYLLQQKSDKELEEFNNKLKQGIAYQGVAIANQSKILRYTRETNEVSSGGRGGKTTNGGNTTNYAVGSVGYLEDLISKLQKQIKLQVDSSEIEKLQKQIEDANEQLELLVNPQKLDLKKIDGLKTFAPSKLNSTIPTEPIVKDLATVYKEASEQINNILDAYNMGIIGRDKAQQWIDEVNKTLQANKLKPIEIHIETDIEKVLSNVSNVVSELGASFSSLGKALEIPELDVAGMIAGAIASIISGYATATTQAATLGPLAWLGFGLAGLAQVAAIIAQIHSLSGYANGGIVGGSRYAGDALLARVNSGEAIVNQNQQKHLFEILNSGNSSVGSSGGNVHFVIRGSELYGVLDNYKNKIKKVI